MKLYGFLFIVFLWLPPVFGQQTEPVTNIDIISRVVENDLNELENRLVLNGREKIYGLRLNNSDELNFLSLKLRQRFNNYNLVISEKPDSVDAEIIFDNIRIKTRYLGYNTENIAGDKSVKRQVTVAYTLKLVDGTGTAVLYTQDFIKTYTDTFKLDDLERVENRAYNFGYDRLPREGFISRYLAPALIIIASAAAVVLFFTIRSSD
jgi:hypothetical protein